jgi:secreted Zn-dependent insulinase-like peptidase
MWCILYHTILYHIYLSVCLSSQVDAASPLTSALLLFMRRTLGEPAFTELRTKKQLGYVVSLSTGGYGRYCAYQ